MSGRDTKVSRSPWVKAIEFSYCILCILDIRFWLPRWFIITSPFHQELKFSAMNSRIQDFINLVLFFLIHYHWWGFGEFSFWNQGRFLCWAETIYMEDWVTLVFPREFKLVVVVTDLL